MADSGLPSTLCESTPPPMADADLSLHAPCEPSSSNPTPSDQVESESLTGTVDRWDEHVRSPLRSGSVSCSVAKTSDESGSTRNGESSAGAKSLEDHVREWKEKRAMDGVAAMDYALPFLTNDPKLMECRLCFKGIYTGEEIRCTVSGCQSAFHLNCAENTLKLSKEKISSKDELNNSKKGSKDPKFERLRFKCPLHGCFVCKQIGYWRCVKCVIASHNKCAPWKEDVMFLPDQHALAVCWKHPSNWLHQNQHTDVTQSIQEVFARLPVPYFEEEFSFNNDDVAENINEPTRFDRIRRNIYHIKRKRESHTGVGCRSCTSDSTCKDDCECRGVSVSCSKACHCSDFCTNKPFRKDKKIKIVKTENCGWGVITLEPLEKGDFIVEYIGEVIDDRMCEKRLWDIKKRGDFNFYMCEISKDFTIDATFKGNTSRFLNHSCDPNCKLEKWQVEGETRVGVFASRSIKTGEPLTYDYRFVHFGPMVVCKCGATNCQGFLGSKKIAHQEPFNTEVLNLEEILPDRDGKNFVWGQKTKRSELVKTTNQSLLSNGSQIFQNQFNLVETPQELPPIPIKEDPPLSWGRRIKRSYTVSVDQNGSGGN